MKKIFIHTDGGARGNPGPAGAGAVIADEQGKTLAEVSDYLGETTNNVAEYEALVRALERAEKLFGAKLRDMEIEVLMDSELIVRQMQGIYKVKHPALRELFARVAVLKLECAPNIVFKHVRREHNKHADKLVNAAIDRGLGAL